MTLESEAAEVARDRYASRLIEDYDGDVYEEDEYGYDATARQAFIEGAVWASQREPSPQEIQAAATQMYAIEHLGESHLPDDWEGALFKRRAHAVLMAARDTREKQ